MTARRRRRARALLVGAASLLALFTVTARGADVCSADAYLPASVLAMCRPDAKRLVDEPRCLAAAYPTKPADAVDVTTFGARADDDVDDGEAIGRALQSLRPGQWLVFPPGRYLHGDVLSIRQRGVTIWGEGATLHATNPLRQALRIAADDVAVYRLRLTAATQSRGDQPLQSRVAIYPDDERQSLRGTTLRGLRIVHDDAVAAPNASAAAGIFAHGAIGFRIEDNEISRSLADGIHLTAGSHDGLVARNRIRQTGDDTIAVVSYLKTASGLVSSAGEIAGRLLIIDNDVGDPYWGRGIAVVGGQAVAIVGNRITDVAMAASVYVARESYWLTQGVTAVLVADNVVDGNQTRAPSYNFRGTYDPSRRTEQGGIELYTWVWARESAIASLRDRLGVSDVAICRNEIRRTRHAAIRIGAGTQGEGGADDHQGRRDAFVGGPIQRVTVAGNRFAQVPIAVDVHPQVAAQVACRPVEAPSAAGGLSCPR